MLQNTITLYKYYLLGRVEIHGSVPNRDDAPSELVAAWALGVYEQGDAQRPPSPLRNRVSLVKEIENMMGYQSRP